MQRNFSMILYLIKVCQLKRLCCAGYQRLLTFFAEFCSVLKFCLQLICSRANAHMSWKVKYSGVLWALFDYFGRIVRLGASKVNRSVAAPSYGSSRPFLYCLAWRLLLFAWVSLKRRLYAQLIDPLAVQTASLNLVIKKLHQSWFA